MISVTINITITTVVNFATQMESLVKKIILTAMLALLVSGASAQISNFTGFSAGINLNATAITTRMEANNLGEIERIGTQSWNGSAQTAYALALSPSSVVSAGLMYGLGASGAGTISNDNGDLSGEAKSQLSIYVEPGFLVSEKTLVYGKISYERASLVTSSGGDSVSRKLTGYGYGAGVRTFLDKSTYLQFETRSMTYNSVKDDGFSATPHALIGSIGFGVKF